MHIYVRRYSIYIYCFKL